MFLRSIKALCLNRSRARLVNENGGRADNAHRFITICLFLYLSIYILIVHKLEQFVIRLRSVCFIRKEILQTLAKRIVGKITVWW